MPGTAKTNNNKGEQMAAALKHAGKVFEFVVLPHEDHFLSREATIAHNRVRTFVTQRP
jgi:dipeptidyl aminopeptidase/acylaminoacyl peptidase